MLTATLSRTRSIESENFHVSIMGLLKGPTIHPPDVGEGHPGGGSTVFFICGPPSTTKTGQQFSVTIGLPSPRQPDPSFLSESSSEAIHISMRLAESNAAVNFLSGNLTSTISRINGRSPSSVTFNGICVAKAGRFRLRALLGIDSGVGVRIASTVNSNIFEVLA
jgi:hypothetical protein